jgi:hypothetical protein
MSRLVFRTALGIRLIECKDTRVREVPGAGCIVEFGQKYTTKVSVSRNTWHSLIECQGRENVRNQVAHHSVAVLRDVQAVLFRQLGRRRIQGSFFFKNEPVIRLIVCQKVQSMRDCAQHRNGPSFFVCDMWNGVENGENRSRRVGRRFAGRG